MSGVYKQDQVYAISKSTRLSKSDIKKVIDSYIAYVRDKALNGETVKFLNICYLSSGSKSSLNYRETKSYVSTEIAIKLRMSKEAVYRVLSDYENIIIEDLVKKNYSYVIHGLINISVIEYTKDVYKVRIRKSDSLANRNIRVLTLNSFKRKVEN